MFLSIWIKLLDAHFLVNYQQSMRTDVSAIFIIREIKAAVLRLCARKALSEAFTLWEMENLAV